MIKRIFCILLSVTLLFSITACKPRTDMGLLNPEDEWQKLTSTTYGTVEVTSAKTAYNYLTGEMNLAEDRVGLRPYCISVNNNDASWPQKGTLAADVIIEMETEGGITRFMCLYSDTREISLIGSVRSLRDQFIEAIYPVDPIIVHIGTSIYADKAISQFGLQTIDGNYSPSAIYIDPTRRNYDSEHTKFTSGKLIFDAIDALKIQETSRMKVPSYFNFTEPDTTVIPDETGILRFSFDFSNSGYDGDFQYDNETGTWFKFQRNRPQIDVGEESNGTQLSFQNVLVMFADITTIENAMGLVNVNYQTGGDGFYFTLGGVIPFTWSKGDYESNFTFTDENGKSLTLNTGKTMMCIVRNTFRNSLEIIKEIDD